VKDKLILAGLLARAARHTFPSWQRPEQWSEVLRVGVGTHSYGDSAGFTPDFPFNPPLAEPKSAQIYRARRIAPTIISLPAHFHIS